jgi:hypothetical protein
LRINERSKSARSTLLLGSGFLLWGALCDAVRFLNWQTDSRPSTENMPTIQGSTFLLLVHGALLMEMETNFVMLSSGMRSDGKCNLVFDGEIQIDKNGALEQGNW